MAKAVTLKNQNNEEVYPVTDISLVNGDIPTGRIADAAVTEAKLADGAVTTAKIDSTVVNNLFCKAGDVLQGEAPNTQHGAAALNISGGLTSSATDVYLSIPIGKSLANVSTATINKMAGYARCNGAYLTNMNSNTSDFVTNSTSVATRVNKGTNTIEVCFYRSGGWGGTNNAPVTFQGLSYKITLS